MKKKRVVNKNRIVKFFIVTLVLVLSLAVAGVIIYEYKKNKDASKEITTVKVTDTIDGYDYTLNDNATDYYKDLFNKLKSTLSNSTVDEKDYVNLVSQMFTTDFYTLSNKLTSSDIGGVQFVSADYQDNFKLAAQNSIYKSVKSNIYGDRSQDLPTVTKASVDSVDTTTYKYGNNKDTSAYSVKVSLTYDTDLGYPTSVKLIIIHNDKKLEVAKVS